jgi:hypothetical protein
MTCWEERVTLTKQDEFEALFRSLIERHTPALTAHLRELLRTPPPPEMEVLLFVIFSEWRDFPIEAGVYNREETEVYFKAPFYGRILKRKFIPSGAIDQAAFEDAGVATFETGAVIIAEWFGDCWHEAGGERFPVPAFIEHHDRFEAYDLRRRCWVEDEDMWK